MAENNEPSLDRSKKTILVVDTSLDEKLIDALHRRYDPPHGEGVNVVVISTVPADWDGKDFSVLTDPRHLNNANQWLFDKSKVNHLILVKEDPKLGYPSVKQLADEINALDLNIAGILSHPYNAFIDLEMAELCENVRGLERYPTREQVSAFKDKPTANAFMEMLKEKYNFDELITPWEAKIEGADEGELAEGLEGLKELKRLFRDKVAEYIKTVMEEGDDQKTVPWKFILKPVTGDGSLGAVELSSDLSKAEIDALLEHHWEELQLTRTRKSILQEFVGEIELGYHGYKNGPHIHHELTIKEMHGNKETAHIDPGYRNHQIRRWQKAIFPVMEKVFEELGIDIGHLNADIRVGKWSAKFCPVDLQIRSGFGHPEMKNAVYGTEAQLKKPWHGRDVEQLFVAMGLNMGEEDVEDAMAKLQRLKPKRAAIAATIIPEGGHFLLANVTDARLEAARNMPGIIDISIPDLKAGDQIPEIKSLLTAEGHIFIEACGKDLDEAKTNACNALVMAGVAVIRSGLTGVKDLRAIFNGSPYINPRARSSIEPFTVTLHGATDSEAAYTANVLNYGVTGPLPKNLAGIINGLFIATDGIPQTSRGLKERIDEVEEQKAGKQVPSEMDTAYLVDFQKTFGAVAGVYQQAVADGFSETKRTSPKWNGVSPSYTTVKPSSPVVGGVRWSNDAKGPKEIFKAREDRIAKRRGIAPKSRLRGAVSRPHWL